MANYRGDQTVCDGTLGGFNLSERKCNTQQLKLVNPTTEPQIKHQFDELPSAQNDASDRKSINRMPANSLVRQLSALADALDRDVAAIMGL